MKCNLCDCHAELGPEDKFCGDCGHPASAHVREESVLDLGDIAAMYLRGEIRQSRARLLDYVREKPSDALAWTILGNVHKDLDEDSEAEQAYRKAIELNPQAYQAYTGLGMLYRKRGEYDRAMTYYDKAVEINTRYAQAYSSMSIIELKRHHDQRALELAQKAYQLDDKDPIMASNLAVAYHYNNMLADRDRMYEVSRKLGYRDLHALDRIFNGEISVRD
jgi:tetratricopeptide (TPR) repeat protein